jgi:hypothetical protein
MSKDTDRLELIMNPANTSVTGIDFIYMYASQVQMDIHFLQPPHVLIPALSTTLTQTADISIYCPAENNNPIPVTNLSWTSPDVLQLQVASPGDFALYKLKITSAQIDPYYNDVTFSFKAGCPSALDCKPQPGDCPEVPVTDFPIDYLARDFWSFRTALLDFATLRYPGWPDRLEADAGVMMAELMSAIGDEMAYHQDRVGREGFLETASQRRSIRRLARLVDYTVHDGLGASAWIDFNIKIPSNGNITAGTNVWAGGDSGQRVDFEIGHGLTEEMSPIPKAYHVDFAIDAMAPHIWDKDQLCLSVGTTQLYLEGNLVANLAFDDFPVGGSPGKWMVIQTSPTNPAQQPRSQLIRVIQVSLLHDPVIGDDTTLIVWETAQALMFEYDMTILTVHGNILPATAGKTQTAYFIVGGGFSDLSLAEQQTLLTFIGLTSNATIPRAIEREGHDGTVVYRFTLPGSDTQSMVWLGDDPTTAQPEILLRQLNYDAVHTVFSIDNNDPWTWRRSLMSGDYSSEPENRDYTFDDGNWTRVVGYQDVTKTIVHRDYASGEGLSVIFGDGEFGFIPAPFTVFRVDYRLGGGNISNVAALAINNITDVPPSAGSLLVTDINFVINPLAAINGLDPQTPDVVRQEAPEAFQKVTYRAVTPPDYEEAAERLAWVQKAGASFRWTGSWISAFVTADPLHQVGLTVMEESDLLTQENRFRQAGREVIINQPVYAYLDMHIEVCAMPDAYAGEVYVRVMDALFGNNGYPPVTGYFSPDRFTFGTVLERSTLEAAIQKVPGVLAVEWIRFRRRGFFDWKSFKEFSYDPGINSIICIANDPLHPEEGILKLNIHAGL